VPTSAATASILSLHFDPAQGLPPQDAMTAPLLRLMLATDDVRLSRRLFLETSERLRAAVLGGMQWRLLTGEQWYGLRLLCLHLDGAIDALRTLEGTVSPDAVRRLLTGQADVLKAFETVSSIAQADKATREQTFVFKVRTWVVAHYQNQDVERLYRAYAGVPGYLDGMVTGSNVGGLVRFLLTDTLVVLLLLDAAGAMLPTAPDTDAGRARLRTEVERAWAAVADEVLPLAEDLTTFVDSLVYTLVKGRGSSRVERTSIDIPPLLRAAWETEAARRANQQSEQEGVGDGASQVTT